MPRGGRRSGAPSTAYGNRSDLNQPVRTAPSQQYGDRAAQEAAQQAMPLPQTPGVPTGDAPMMTAPPPDPGLLSAPSARPGEPVTAGLPIGAGPGPEAMAGGPGADDQVLANLYTAYRLVPTEGLRALIEQTERLGG